jgi:hypothetical protein
VDARPEPDRDTRRDDNEALEEIRRLFARYRRGARHGQVTERDEPSEVRAEEEDDAAALTRR